MKLTLILTLAIGFITQQANAQLGPLNHVLQLDGDGDFVELPAEAFTDLESATIEAWVNWESFQESSRVFAFTLKDARLVNLMNRITNPDLWSEYYPGDTHQWLQVPGVLTTNEWVHLALVVEPGSLKVHLNGMLLSDQVITNPALTRSAEFSRLNFLGRGNARVVWLNDADFHGQMDEVRVWRGERTEQQIQANLLTRLTGKEPELVALYPKNVNGHYAFRMAGSIRCPMMGRDLLASLVRTQLVVPLSSH